MDIKIEKLPKSELKLTVKLAADAWEAELAKSLKALGTKVKVPGFREGKAPEDVVKKSIGTEKLIGYTIETKISTYYADAVKKEGLTPLARPVVDIVSDNPLEFTAIVAVKPDFEIAKLDKIKIKAPKIEVTEEQVAEAIDHILKSRSELKDKTGKSAKGDQIEIDFEGKDADGVVIDGAVSKNHPVVIGDGNFIPGFEDNLLDLETGDEKTFTVTFPADYHAKNLQSKPVTFTIKVVSLKERILPEITEEFTESVIGKKLDQKAFKDFLKHELEHEQLHKKKNEQEDELFSKLLESTDFEVSDQLVEEEAQILLGEMRQGITKQGMNPDDYFKFLEAKDKMPIEEIFKPKATDRVKIRFIIEYVIKSLGIDATPEEINEKADLMASKAPKEMIENVKKYYAEGQPGREALRQQIILDKIFERFLEPLEHNHDHCDHA